MKITLTTLILFLSTAICAQGTITTKIKSRILSKTRELRIYVPEGYKIDSLKKYPLTIVLDAEELFDIYVSNAKLFALHDKAPEQIIIGINQARNNDRYKDCSYEKHNSYPVPSAQLFIDFVRSELLPFAEDNYRVSNFKTIVGNSLTGNFINYFLIEHQPTFNAFITINPSFAPEMSFAIENKVKIITNIPLFYYLSNGNYNSIKKSISITGIATRLKDIENSHFKFHYDLYNQASRIASIGQSLASAQAFIFKSFAAISNKEYKEKIADLTPPEAIAYLENKYLEIEQLFGANFKIRERDIYAVEGIILDQENGDYLKDFGKMIQKLYPESPLGDYYLGNYYETGGKLKKALRHYKNGYSKVKGNEADAIGYYQNIIRVLDLQKDEDSEEIEAED